MLGGLQYRTRRRGPKEPKDLKSEDPPHGNLMTAFVVHTGKTKLGILVTALVDQTGTTPHGIQGALMPGLGMVLMRGKVTIVTKAEIAANHAAETNLVGGNGRAF